MLALLVTGCWFAATSRMPRLAGFLLGAAAAVKLFPILLVGFFVLTRRWITALWSIVSAVLLSVFGAIVVGPEATMTYWAHGLPAATNLRADSGNYSLHGSLWRLFAGTEGVPALFDHSSIGWGISAGASLLVIGAAYYAILVSDDENLCYSIAILSLLLAIPVTLQYYLVMLVWPLITLGARLRAKGWPVRASNIFAISVVAMGLPLSVYGLLAVAAGLVLIPFSGTLGTLPPDFTLSPVTGIALLLLPLGPLLSFSLGLWMAFSSRQSGVASRQHFLHLG